MRKYLGKIRIRLNFPKPKEQLYYIVSIKHTRGEKVCFWRPNNAGYTEIINDAGKYTEEQVKSSQNYYNNFDSSIAVPCEVVTSKILPYVPNEMNIMSIFKDLAFKN